MEPEPTPPNPAAEWETSPDSARGREPFIRLVSLLSGLALLALALALLAPWVPTSVDLAEVSRVIVFEPQFLKPEPRERVLYVAGVLFLPFALGGAYIGVRRLAATAAGRRLAVRMEAPVAWLPGLLFVVLLVVAGYCDDRKAVRTLVPGGVISLAIAVALSLGIEVAAGRRLRERADRFLRWLLPPLAGLLFLAVLSFGILGPEHIRNAPIFWSSFNAVFHSVVQVFLGEELLVDFTNQYGLYPHFLEPLFSLVGLGVYSFTTLMGLLNCLAFLCMYRFLARETGDELLSFLGLTTIVFTGYVSGRVEQPDLYLQYHPIRTLFPALALWVVHGFARKPSLGLGTLLLGLGAAAVLWNPDTGLIVLAAGSLLLAYDALLRRRPGEIPLRLLLGAGSAAAVVAAFSILLRLRFGGFPDYGKLVLYPKGFFLYGYNMLPMPPLGLWLPVLVLYAAALLLALAALFRGEESARARIHFFLAVLGIGLFSYYQGRSHLGNLGAAGYPAILIGVLFVDGFRRRELGGRSWTGRLARVAVLTFLCLSVPSLVAVGPAWTRGIAEKVRVARSDETSDVLSDSLFLRRFVRPGEEIYIMSFHSGLHHLMTRTTSPLDIPGQSELLFRADNDKENDYVAYGRGIFAIDRKNMKEDFVNAVTRAYKTRFENPTGSLIVLPKPGPRSSR